MRSLTKRIAITGRCNENCIFCSGFLRKEMVPRRFNHKNIKKSLQNRNGCTRLNITGGEPTLSKDLMTYIALAKKTGYQQIALMTNARKCSDKFFTQELKKSGLTDAVVSIQHLSPTINRNITQNANSLEEKTLGIKNLAAANIEITANILIYIYNYNSLLKLTKNLHVKFGIRRFAFSFIEPNCDNVRDRPNLIPDIKKSLLSLRKAVDYCKKRSLQYYIPYDGALPPCIFDKFKIRTNEPEIIIGSDFDKPNSYFSFCKACRHIYSCRGVLKEYFVKCLRILCKN